MAGLPFTCCPVSPQFRFDAQVFRVLLLPLVPTSFVRCKWPVCGRPLDSCGHHRSACPLVGVFGHRGFFGVRPLGCTARLELRVHDLDLLHLIIDQSRLLLTGCHCSTRRSWQWTPPWCRQSDVVDGATLTQARRRKELTCPELTGEHGRARLVVPACEVCGLWSDETCLFIAGLARASNTLIPFHPNTLTP